ncbi:MAG: acyl-CoA dehydrogenase family protein [Actinomycetes bacterium]
MDFALTDEQDELRKLAAELLDDHCTPEALTAAERSETPGFDQKLWSKLADAGLLGIAIPEEHGGLGFTFFELSLLLEEVGRTVAPVPAYALVLGALPLVRHGSSDQKSAWLAAVARGEKLVTGAYAEPLGEPNQPGTTARRDGDGWVLDGVKTCVPGGTYADAIVVSAMTDDGGALFLLDPAADGLTRETQQTISYTPEAHLVLDGVRVGDDALVGTTDGSALADTLQFATAAACALQVGVATTAVKLTAEYVKTREQFGRPIALFQAVGQRAADAFIDTNATRLTTLHAVWRLGVGLPAEKQVAVAKYFASEAGQRVVRAAAHLHGGMGVSREYPLHRYYIWAKQLELTLGSGTRQLATLGRLLADEPVSVPSA